MLVLLLLLLLLMLLLLLLLLLLQRLSIMRQQSLLSGRCSLTIIRCCSCEQKTIICCST